MNDQGIQTIRGYVQALPAVSGRTGKEDTARVAVITEDGTHYHVLHKGPGIGLLDDINASVEVFGFASPLEYDAEGDDAPRHMLTVKSYRLIDGFDDPWYDDTVR